MKDSSTNSILLRKCKSSQILMIRRDTATKPWSMLEDRELILEKEKELEERRANVVKCINTIMTAMNL